MRIERVTGAKVADVYCCLEDRRKLFEGEISESLGYMKEKLEQGWLTYAVYGEAEAPIGMAILVPPSDPLSPISGEGVYYFHCLDITKEARKQGIGTRLVEKIVDEVKALAGKGVAVVCYGEYWMSCEFFKKAGFEQVKTFPDHSLLLKRISDDAKAELVEAPYRGDLPESGIQVDVQHAVACPFMISNFRKAKDIVKRIEPEAVIRERIISTKEDMRGWGGSGFYVNGKSVSAGPIDEDGLKKAIEEAKRT